MYLGIITDQLLQQNFCALFEQSKWNGKLLLRCPLSWLMSMCLLFRGEKLLVETKKQEVVKEQKKERHLERLS